MSNLKGAYIKSNFIAIFLKELAKVLIKNLGTLLCQYFQQLAGIGCVVDSQVLKITVLHPENSTQY